MYCADNQFCAMQNCGDGRCVGANVICGEGTVAQGLACVPTDQSNNCHISILPLSTTWKKYDATDCEGAHTRIDGSKYFGGSQNKWQTEYTVKRMLAECKSKCAENEACVAFNFRDDREQLDYEFGGSYCQFWSTITDTPDAADGLDSK